jgi:hypothetical protein
MALRLQIEVPEVEDSILEGVLDRLEAPVDRADPTFSVETARAAASDFRALIAIAAADVDRSVLAKLDCQA